MSRLDRFKVAQDSPLAGFAAALAELQAGRKTGHWIWYVFPQIAGLGSSGFSQTYAIADAGEAADYLRDVELRSRLQTIAEVVARTLRDGGGLLRELMGSEIDARKLVSSMTLFGHVARRLADEQQAAAFGSMAAVAEDILALADAQGYPPCAHTLRRLGAGR